MLNIHFIDILLINVSSEDKLEGTKYYTMNKDSRHICKGESRVVFYCSCRYAHLRINWLISDALFQFPTVGNDDLGFRRAALCALLLHRLDNIDAVHNAAKHHVFPVEPGGKEAD